MTTNNEIRKEITRSAIKVEDVFESKYQKQPEIMRTAQLRQEITILSYYPKARISNNMQDNVFNESDFGIEENEPYETKEKRVAFINVPKDKTVAEIQAVMDNLKNAVLYRVLDNEPILTEDDKSAIKNGKTTLAKKADGQVVRFPDEHDKAGQLCLDKNNKLQYRHIFFKQEYTEDIDKRDATSRMYASEELAKEYNSVVVAQEQGI